MSYEVHPNADGGWALLESATEEIRGVFPTLAGAEDAAVTAHRLAQRETARLNALFDAS